jgi:hypothetical protein
LGAIMSGKNKKILEGHKKVVTRFIPPMMQLGLTEISYVHQIFPEIIWMALVNEKFGYRGGIRLIENVAKAATEVKGTEKHLNFSLSSSFSELTPATQENLLEILSNRKILLSLQQAIAPLVILYKGFPMSFIGKPNELPDNNVLINILKNSIDKYIDKYETPSLIIQSNILYIRSLTGGLHFSSHIDVPDLNIFFTDPDSYEAKRAAGFVRSGALTEFMPMGEVRPNDWAKLFWNQNYHLDACDFSWENDDNN